MAAAAPAAAAPPAPAAPDEMVWVVVESRGGRERGQVVAAPEAAMTRGAVGWVAARHGGGEVVAVRRMRRDEILSYVGEEASRDARILAVSGNDQGRRVRMWRDVVSELSVSPFVDWPISGPRTTEWCLRFINRRGGGPLDHHFWWKQTHSLGRHDYGVDIHENGMRAIERAGCYDGLDLCNLACVEVMMRQLQLVEYVYAQDALAAPSTDAGGKAGRKGRGRGRSRGALLDESAVFLSAHRDDGEMMVCPELLSFVSAEVSKDASVMKEVRKAREERKLLRGDDA